MRVARLVGLSPDGTSIIVATDSGEHVAIAADDRLRAALRGDRSRLGQLEIEMESALSPREIQSRIRSGEPVDEVARVAGLPRERVERFAAPVLAERDHIAIQAMTSSVRRRGETSAHRNLRVVVQERLLARGVDLNGIDWDSYRTPDGRWAVTAAYRSGEVSRRAEFLYDAPGRFSVAGNDEARWILGDTSPVKGPQPGRRRPGPDEPRGLDERERPDEAGRPDDEPTLDLSDELALVRAVQDAPVRALESDQAPAAAEAPEEAGPDDRAGSARGGAGPSGPSDAAAVPAVPLRVVEGGWEPAILVDFPVEPEPSAPPTEEPGPPDPPTYLEDRQDEATEFAEEHEVVLEELGDDLKTGPSPEPAPPEPTTAKGARRKRAAVPSWDEIMFGGPKPG